MDCGISGAIPAPRRIRPRRKKSIPHAFFVPNLKPLEVKHFHIATLGIHKAQKTSTQAYTFFGDSCRITMAVIRQSYNLLY